MRKLLVCILVLLLLSGCGEKPPVQTPPEEPAVTAPDKGTAGEKRPEKSEETAPEAAPERRPVPLRLAKGEGWLDEWSDDFKPLCTAAWEDIVLMDDYPGLAEALRELNAEQSAGACAFREEWLPYAREALAENPEYFGGFTSDSAYTIRRADSLLLSIREDVSSYTGGVHGNYGVVGLNFDTATGRRLALRDVLTDTEGLDEILAEKIRTRYTFEPFESLELMLADYTAEQYTWTLDYQGITFYFSPYEIASYAAGLLTATIWFDELPELFRDEYTPAPAGGYAAALPYWNELEIDLIPGDGVRDTLSCRVLENEYGAQHLIVSLNGQEYTEEAWCAFSITPYLVWTGERFCLCAEGAGENDFRTLYRYDLTGTQPQLAEEYPNTGFYGRWDSESGVDGDYHRHVFTDPGELTLASRCNLLGTNTAFRTYTVTADGGLSPVSEEYALEATAEPIVSSVPLEVTILPQDTVETVPAGTAFSLLRTDNEGWVELEMDDGRQCRIVIEQVDYTPTIGGVPEWECFDNLMYAG